MTLKTFSSRNFIHPFPARMAPDVAIDEIARLPSGSAVLDPMMGSGTVLLAANEQGHSATGTDLDPLAVLIASVANAPLEAQSFLALVDEVVRRAATRHITPSDLSWITKGDETEAFIEFWFAEKQRNQLSALSYEVESSIGTHPERDVDALRVCLSKVIITKEMRASLARDTSHSRPHRVAIINSYDVFEGFRKAAQDLLAKHSRFTRTGRIIARRGDAREIFSQDSQFDAIISSPPYLNAIDYLRGHRMALVWLGYKISELRGIRASSVGAERKGCGTGANIDVIVSAFGDISTLSSREKGMIGRYGTDLGKMASEAYRVLRTGGRAIYVIGNSCLKGVYVDNAAALQVAAELSGFRLSKRWERVIPEQSRYLPISEKSGANLSKRMRKEIVLCLEK